MKSKPPLAEEEAIALFLTHAADARRGEPLAPNDADRVHLRTIVRLLDFNRAAIVLAAARASTSSPAEIAAALEALGDATTPDPEVRVKLARGEANRLGGRLPQAASDLEAVLREASGDPFAQAEAHRILGAVYRAQGRFEDALAHKREAVSLHEMIGDRPRRAVAHGEVGTVLMNLGRLREARVHHEEALAAHRQLGRRREEGVELSYLGVALHRLGLFEEARRAHEAALAIHVETSNVRLEAADRLHLGYVEHELGRFDVARERFEAARGGFRRAEDRALEGVTLSWWGALEVEAHAPERAGPLLQEAMALHREAGSARHEATTWRHLALHHRALGEAAEAARCLEESLAKGEGRVEIEHHAWTMALLGGERLARAAAIEMEDARTRRAIEGVALAAAAPASPRARAWLDEAPVGSRERLARVELERAAATTEGGARLLEVGPDARWFRPQGQDRVDLARRRPLRLALLLLVERRIAAPGVGVGWEEVLTAAWPGERVQAQAGFARVRNALAQLRKLGLRTEILTRDDGYLLDPEVTVQRVI